MASISRGWKPVSWRVSSRIADSPSSPSQRFMPGLVITSSRKRVTIWTSRSGPVAVTSSSMLSSVRRASDQITSTSSVSRDPTQR